MTPTKFFSNYFDMDVKKRRILCWVRIRWKSIKKVYTEKVIGLRNFDTHIEIIRKNTLFANFEAERAQNSSKKRTIFFFQTWLGITYIFHFWFRISKLLKSFHPIVYVLPDMLFRGLFIASSPKLYFMKTLTRLSNRHVRGRGIIYIAGLGLVLDTYPLVS